MYESRKTVLSLLRKQVKEKSSATRKILAALDFYVGDDFGLDLYTMRTVLLNGHV